MLEVLGRISAGYNPCTDENGKYAFTRMDTGVLALPAGQQRREESARKERAFLLLSGSAVLKTAGASYSVRRGSLFTEGPFCLHVAAGVAVDVIAEADCEFLVMAATNPTAFPEVFYTPADVKDRYLGDGVWGGTAKRLIRDIFNYDNAPYSNLVLGEIINLPGRWSSYTPHWHRQPEVYYYRFDRPQGFGACFIGDNAYTVRHDSFAAIPGGLCHPQVTAPGYAMYYAWIIRHLENDPWNERIMDPAHQWLNEPDACLFEPAE